MAKLEDVAQVYGGGTPSRSESSYFGGGIAWATPTDITALDQLYISKTKETVSEAGLKNSSAKLMPAGAVLLTSRATIGYTAVSTVPICTNQGFINFVCGTELVPEYLAFWLRTQKDKMIQHAGGTTFREIARGTLRKFEIPVPPLDEQRRIVDILSRAEGIVRLRREAEKKAAELVPALFLAMFGDPATNPKGWPVAEIGKLGRVQLGRQRAPKYQTGLYTRPYVRVANVFENRIDVTDLLSMDFHEKDFAQYRLDYGDILLNEGQSTELVGRPAMWRGEIADCCFQNTLVRFQPDKDRMVPEFALAAMLHYYRTGVLSKISSKTSNVAHLGAGRFSTLPLYCPSLDRQRMFAGYFEGIRSIQAQQAEAMEKSQASFNALLARVFSQQRDATTSHVDAIST